jgi:NAD(P)-dependent dehydrogenase (short-subunit alcohol dehydrogenase family)
MNLKLDQKLALVTGGTKGIGFAIAKRLLDEGAKVAITGRTKSSLDAALLQLTTLGRVIPIVADLSNAAGAAAVVESIAIHGTPDILVNNVGFFEVRDFFATDDAAWASMFELNVMSGVRLSRALMPAMLNRKTGRIIFVASEQSSKPNPQMAHYAMTKAANVSVSRALAELTRGTDVTVNSILVAPTWTEGVEAFLSPVAAEAGLSLEETRNQYFTQGDGITSLLGRFAKPEEIADVIAFIASPLSSAVNGTALRADGGIIRSLF